MGGAAGFAVVECVRPGSRWGAHAGCSVDERRPIDGQRSARCAADHRVGRPRKRTAQPAMITEPNSVSDVHAGTGHENTDRILRMFARFITVGYVAYLA